MWIVECAIENYACARAIAVVVPYEAGALVTRKACFPCLGIVFDLFCGRKLFVWRIEACDFSVWADSILSAIGQPSIVLGVLCSSSLLGVLCSRLQIVTKFIWNLDATKAVGAAKHRHHALNGASQRQLLVRMTDALVLPLPCYFPLLSLNGR